MKRDMDLVRQIMLVLEETNYSIDAQAFIDDTHDIQAICYHFEIMQEAGLIYATVKKEMSGSYIYGCAINLTWQGQEFIANVKDDKLWSRVKLKAAKVLGSASFATISSLALQEIKILTS